MLLNKIVIACFKKDLFLLRPCVASIRYWYPDVEIYLLKDIIQGDFSIAEFQRGWNCHLFETPMHNFGWPWSKLAILLKSDKERYLFLDSDTVFLGPVLDELNKFSEDFIVTGIEADQNDQQINDHYIDMSKINNIDNEYVYPGFAFNGGHIVMTSGVISKDYMSKVIGFSPIIHNKYPDIFKHGDQGCLNYIFAKGKAENQFTVRHHNFWIWPGIPAAKEIDLNAIKLKQGIPFILHWAGIKPVDFRKYIRYDILSFYKNIYYRPIKYGFILKHIHHIRQITILYMKLIKYKILGLRYE
jgi:lipopolysaccharide biosynthesis glycosyltransferase